MLSNSKPVLERPDVATATVAITGHFAVARISFCDPPSLSENCGAALRERKTNISEMMAWMSL